MRRRSDFLQFMCSLAERRKLIPFSRYYFPKLKNRRQECVVCEFFIIMVVLNQWNFKCLNLLPECDIFKMEHCLSKYYCLLTVHWEKKIVSVNEEICCRCLSRVLKVVTVVSYKCIFIFWTWVYVHCAGTAKLGHWVQRRHWFHFWKNLIAKLYNVNFVGTYRVYIVHE